MHTAPSTEVPAREPQTAPHAESLDEETRNLYFALARMADDMAAFRESAERRERDRITAAAAMAEQMGVAA